MNNLKFIDNNIDLDSIYSKIKSYKRIESSIGYYDNVYVHTVDLENSLTGEKLSKTMENMYNYKYVPKSFESKYYTHKFIIDGYLNKNGKFEILKIDADSIFDKRKIENYIKNSRFKSDIVPKETKRIFIAQPSYAGFQSFDEKTAALVTKKEKEERYKKYLENFDREEIKGFYIPKNLLECMLELDKQMKFSDKEIVKKAHSAFEFNGHMDGFGIWIRNNWGINSSSRLLKYFNDRGIGNDYDGNEEISELIIEQYIKWLNGDKESSKRWEKQNPVIQNTKYRTINEF